MAARRASHPLPRHRSRLVTLASTPKTYSARRFCILIFKSRRLRAHRRRPRTSRLCRHPISRPSFRTLATSQEAAASIAIIRPHSCLISASTARAREAYSIESLAASFNARTSFLYFLPYNSNSFTYSLLTDSRTPIPSIVNSYLNAPVVFAPGILGTIGIGISWQQAPGWGLLIPPWAGN